MLTALVTRLDCDSGVTGTVNDPDIELADDEVLLTFTVTPGDPAGGGCQGNDEVACQVQLPEALGDRALVDGACASTRAGDTASCQPGGVR